MSKFNIVKGILDRTLQQHNQKVIDATSNDPRSMMGFAQSAYNYAIHDYPDKSPAPLLQQQGQSPRGKNRVPVRKTYSRKQIRSTSHPYSRRRYYDTRKRRNY